MDLVGMATPTPPPQPIEVVPAQSIPPPVTDGSAARPMHGAVAQSPADRLFGCPRQPLPTADHFSHAQRKAVICSLSDAMPFACAELYINFASSTTMPPQPAQPAQSAPTAVPTPPTATSNTASVLVCEIRPSHTISIRSHVNVCSFSLPLQPRVP